MMSKRSVLLATQNPKKAQDLNPLKGCALDSFIPSGKKNCGLRILHDP
jgi:hypothetical protein